MNVDRAPLNVLSLCSGIGGLDLGIRLACHSARVVAYVEREAFTCEVLAARMEDGRMDPAPIWSDLSGFDGKPWRGVVDLVSAGFPCQPWSVAGARRGTEDERWIWPWIARIIREVGPSYVFLENVPGLLAGGLGPVLGDLAALGFDAEWTCVRASDVGAPHRRERVFVLAVSGGPGLGRRRQLTVEHGTEYPPPLRSAATSWPTARARDWKGGAMTDSTPQPWPTPTSMDSRSSGGGGGGVCPNREPQPRNDSHGRSGPQLEHPESVHE